jgi:hypothetical protein
MARFLFAMALAIPMASQVACAHLCPEPMRVVKYCGRDYGDRIHWSPVPDWFTSKDCGQLNPDALASDLYVACYTPAQGFVMRASSSMTPAMKACHWPAGR